MDSFRKLTAIKDQNVKKFMETIEVHKFMYDLTLIKKFKLNFVEWIQSSKRNRFKNLDLFENVQITNGSVQTFDHFYLKHKNKTFRLTDGEFMYHRGALKNEYKFGSIEDLMKGDLHINDNVFIISVPFTGYGKIHEKFDNYMNFCETHNIPVLLDFCHAPVSKNIDIDFKKYTCIETVAFSISKPFYGAEHLRIGVRLQKTMEDDGIDIINSDDIEMINLIGVGITNELIQKFDFDYNWNTYEKIYNEVCENLNLKQTDNILFGIGGSEYDQYNRAGVNRLCLSEEISKKL